MAEETPTVESTEDDWVVGAVNQIVDTVDKVRTKGTDNAVLAVRGLVFGLVAMVFLTAALIFTVAILVRLADAYLPIGAGVGDATWAAYLFIGGLISVLGFGLWASRKNEGMSRVWIAVIVDVIVIVVVISYAVFS